MMHSQLDCFSSDYFSARQKFIRACDAQKGTLVSYENNVDDINQTLVTDTFFYGSKRAENILVLISATHGVEGYCGSAAQIDFLRHLPELPAHTAVLLVHALNPFGFAFNRRVNEHNVDLNRNVVDFPSVPVNPDYLQIQLALTLKGLDSQSLKQSHQQLEQYRQQWGNTRYEKAVSGGQYTDKKGLFYGGQSPSWSHCLVKQLINQYEIDQKSKVIVVDIHSGLGPYGYGEVISDHIPDSSGAKWAYHCFSSNVTEPLKGTSCSVPKHGLMDYLWHNRLPESGCFITLEFGTFSVAEMFSLLQQENYCWQQPVTHGQKLDIQKQLQHYFNPQASDWQEMVLVRCREVINMALSGLLNG